MDKVTFGTKEDGRPYRWIVVETSEDDSGKSCILIMDKVISEPCRFSTASDTDFLHSEVREELYRFFRNSFSEKERAAVIPMMHAVSVIRNYTLITESEEDLIFIPDLYFIGSKLPAELVHCGKEYWTSTFDQSSGSAYVIVPRKKRSGYGVLRKTDQKSFLRPMIRVKQSAFTKNK